MEQNIKSRRGKEKFQHEGFLYVFDKFNREKSVKFWRCEFFNSKDIKCRGRLHTDLDGNVLKRINEHACPSGAENLEAKRIVTALKRRAVETMEAPMVLRANVLQNAQTPVLANVPNKEATKKLVKRARKEFEAPPAVPNTLAELVIPESYQFYNRAENLQEQFLLADSGLYIDNGREQRRRNWVFPVLYCLLSNKTEASYNRMWTLIRNIWLDFAPESVSVDFEIASINAIRENFRCAINGCFFHLVRNLKKCLAENNLTQRYINDPEFAVRARMVTSVAFLPPADISLAVLLFDQGNWEDLGPILNWFFNNYTGRVRMNGTRTAPLFPPELWSVHQRTLEGADRTNNFAEASHRRLQQAFSCAHPTI